MGLTTLDQQVSKRKTIGLLCEGMDKRSGVQRKGWNTRRIPHQKQSPEAANKQRALFKTERLDALGLKVGFRTFLLSISRC
jgi:hypothetical protein